MRKFLILLKKEIRELLTAQMIAPLIITSLLFFALGNILSKEQEKTNKPVEINVINQDKTAASTSLLEILRQSKVNPTVIEKDLDGALDQTKSDKKTALLVIPSGFEQGLVTGEREKIGLYTVINNFSAMGGKSYGNLMSALATVNEAMSTQLISQKLPAAGDPEVIKRPIVPDEFVIIGERKANASPATIMNFVSQQTMFIPIILFIVIIFAAQMIATAIASEKENKTLETLLTAPVSRRSIVISKMMAAGLIALLTSVVYLFSFRSYINGLGSGGPTAENVGELVKELGLNLSVTSYSLLGMSLFVGILVALCLALILGAFAEDIKSVAGLTTPLMVLVTIPYMLTLFLDINSLSTGLKYMVYAIPFSHIFMAAPNLFLQNYLPVILGIVYQFIWFVIFVFIAVKIFSTEKILVLKLNFSKKK